MRNYKKITGFVLAVFLTTALSAQTDIEPEVISYFGGNGDDFGSSRNSWLDVLADGGWVMGGSSSSANYWTSENALFPTRPGLFAMTLTRFDAGGMPVYSTFFGGSSVDSFNSLSTLGDSVIIGGYTQSADYPTTEGSYEMEYPGMQSGVLSCLDTQGGLAWSTYFGGIGISRVIGVNVSTENAIFITGSTQDTTLATPGVHMEDFPDNQQASAYIARFDSNGGLVWCTYYDRGVGALSSSPDGSRIYIYGSTGSDLPAGTGTHQDSFGGGVLDAILSCFDAETGQLLWRTLFGGEADELIGNIDVGEDGRIFISGTVLSASGITTIGVHQEDLAGDYDGFLACFDPNGQQLWGTYFGGQGGETAPGVKVGASSAYITGRTDSPDGIAFGNPMEPSFSGSQGSYLASFDLLSGSLQYSTYLTSALSGNCNPSAVNALVDGKLLVAGTTAGSCLGSSTVNAWQPNYGGGDFDVWYAIYTENTLSAAGSTPKNDLHAFPIPAGEVLTIQGNHLEPNAAFVVYDLLGRQVMKGNLGISPTQLAVGHLPAGSYFLHLLGAENRQVTKFIKE